MKNERELTAGEKEVIELLWVRLPTDPEHADRVLTVFGSKTRLGLVRTLRNMLAEDQDNGNA